MAKFRDLTGQVFGDWKALVYCGSGTRKWMCECIKCGLKKEVTSYGLTGGTQNTCRQCATLEKRVKLNQKFGDWEVIGFIPNDNVRVLCRCSCGKETSINKYTLIAGTSTNCGHLKNRDRVIDLKGQTFGELEVIEYYKDSYWKCKCSCGNVTYKQRSHLLDGRARTCGNQHNKMKRVDLIGSYFGNLRVTEYLKNDVWKCVCTCGNLTNVFGINLVSMKSTLCGCERNIDQVEICNELDKLRIKLGRKPLIPDICKEWKLSTKSVKARLFMCDNIEDKLIDRFGEAEIREIVSLIKSISHPNIEIKVIGDTIVLKDCKLAIKFNTVLQAEKNRPIHLRNELKNYEKQGIRMFSIFEYDWDNTNVKRKIIYHLKEIITQKKEHTGKVSDYYISQISNADTYKFLRQWDVMDYISQRINIGCFYKGELVGVAVYGNLRYSDKYEYELVRILFIPGKYFEGADIKMQMYFEEKYKPNSVMAYCDLGMFTGKVYKRMGYHLEYCTKPGYVWVNGTDVKTRYRTQKSELVRLGLGNHDMTEDEIMISNSYKKIYNCGNAVYVKKFK